MQVAILSKYRTPEDHGVFQVSLLTTSLFLYFALLCPGDRPVGGGVDSGAGGAGYPAAHPGRHPPPAGLTHQHSEVRVPAGLTGLPISES